MRDLFEIAVPCAAFSILFIAFIWQIFTRYILNSPIAWSNEVQVTGYIWTVLPGACYVRRHNKHVAFTVLYDFMGPRVQRAMRIFGNLLIAATYAVLLPYTVRYVFGVTNSTPVFDVSLTAVFFPMILFVLAAVCYSLSDVYHDVRTIVRGEPPRDPRAPAEAAGEGGDGA